MKALIFSDIHNDLRALTRLMAIPADYYFLAGDLVTWARGLDACGPILRPKAAQVYALPGNHESAEQIASFCARFGLNDFHGKTMEIDGCHVAGLGYSNLTPFNTPGEYTEAQIAERLEPWRGLNPLVLICHCPPLGTQLDRIRDGLHAGSQAVRDFVETEQPLYFFCGHIHEAEGVEVQIGRTKAVNVGKQGYLLDFAGIERP